MKHTRHRDSTVSLKCTEHELHVILTSREKVIHQCIKAAQINRDSLDYKTQRKDFDDAANYIRRQIKDIKEIQTLINKNLCI
ncbi:MAG: hypothetical protein GY941_21035 [Planctomycetes bacterium]|nr:hypothetical protein [Planctomycetota bacterium]